MKLGGLIEIIWRKTPLDILCMLASMILIVIIFRLLGITSVGYIGNPFILKDILFKEPNLAAQFLCSLIVYSILEQLLNSRRTTFLAKVTGNMLLSGVSVGVALMLVPQFENYLPLHSSYNLMIFSFIALVTLLIIFLSRIPFLSSVAFNVLLNIIIALATLKFIIWLNPSARDLLTSGTLVIGMVWLGIYLMLKIL